MNPLFPTGKIIKISLITSPFFGLFAAAPPLGGTEWDIKRRAFIFLFFTLMGFCFWMMNLWLCRLLGQSNKPVIGLWRYVLSFVAISIILFLFDKAFLNLMPPPGSAEAGAAMPPPAPGGPGRRPPGGGPNSGLSFLFPLMRGLAMNVFILVLIELILIRERKVQVENENNLLKLAHSEARNVLLQRQLNPHFLFNALSTLQSLTRRNAGDAELYIERLSDMLRFSIHNSVKAIVSLADELAFCEDYLQLQKLRFGDAIQFYIEVPHALQQEKKLPGFSLQLLVENAIKHNVLTRELPLIIKIFVDEQASKIIVQNNYQPLQHSKAGNDTGLKNLSERYSLIGAPPVEVNKTHSFFTVKISLV